MIDLNWTRLCRCCGVARRVMIRTGPATLTGFGHIAVCPCCDCVSDTAGPAAALAARPANLPPGRRAE